MDYLAIDILDNIIILNKLKSKIYAQKLYTSLCNSKVKKIELWSMLKDEFPTFTFSRSMSAAFVKKIRQIIRLNDEFDESYCSRSRDYLILTLNENFIDNEIADDLLRINWVIENVE